MAEIKDVQGMELRDARGNWFYVAHVDREIGISINDEDDKERYCLNREEFLARAKHFNCGAPMRFYHEVFSIMLEDCRAGIVCNNQWDYTASTIKRNAERNFFISSLSCGFH